MDRKTVGRLALASAIAGLLIASAVAPPLAAAQEDACQGFAKDQLIHRLATPNRFSKKPAKEWQDLTRLFEKDRAALEAIFAEQGLGEAAQGFFERIATGQVSEATLSRGDTVEWMVSRDHGQVVSKGPRCFIGKKSYEAFVVEVPVVSTTEAPAATCKISATGDCRAHTLQVDASGSSPGAKVTMNGSPLSLDGQSRWSGPFENRFDQNVQFTTSVQTSGTKTTKTYTFIIPKVCLNLSLAGPPKVTEEKVAGDSCSESATVNACPKPECSITGPDMVKKREAFDVTISGNGQLTLDVVDPKGTTTSLSAAAMDSFTAANKLKKKGEHTFRGSVTTEFGDSATCEKVVCVGRKPCKPGAAAGGGAASGGAAAGGATALAAGGDWILRFFGAAVRSDEEIRTASGPVNGVSERTKLASGSGAGLGIGAEYLVSDRIGVEASLIVGQVGFTFQRDLNDDWGHDDDDARFVSLTAGPNFHLIPDGAVDLYLGPFIGFAEIHDVEFRTLGSTQTFNFDSEFIWGAQIGLDIPFGSSPWGFHLGGRWMDMSIGDNGPDVPELQLDPLLFTAGFAYRF
ncbi:MAG: outer membrane beta-barrel protein [Acidobacteria bacterium]|nr:outer membrane beta-barrel protein [Acidobacteriota bacterium]